MTILQPSPSHTNLNATPETLTPDPPMVGIRSPIGLVVGSCTSHPGVLGSIPKREQPGKTGAPCVKVPGSSPVSHPRTYVLCIMLGEGEWQS